MNLKRINNTNATVIKKENGTEVLVSYSTAVAAFIPDRGFIRTSKKWSQTTTKHVNKWLLEQGADLLKVPLVEQDVLDGMI